MFFSAQNNAPINAPMDTPPTISMGIPASWIAFSIPTCAAPLAPPPPNTRPTEFPVNHRANREKSECIFGSDINTLPYKSFCRKGRGDIPIDYTQSLHSANSALTTRYWLFLVNIRLGQTM